MKEECLKNTFEESMKTPNISSRLAFFDCFPNEFQDYKKRFSIKSDLHSDYGSYLDLFFSLDTVVEIHKYCNKLINLSLGANWNTEEVNSLQKIIQYQYKKHPKELTSCLNQFNPNQVEQFFDFFFSGLYARNNWNEFPSYISDIKCCYPNIYEKSLKYYNSLHSK